MAVAAIVVVAGITSALTGSLRRLVPAELGEGLRVSLSVEPFEVGDSVPSAWNATSFADSLAAQLSLIRGIQAVSRSTSAQYVVRGHITMKDGRLVLATRLGRDGARDTVWTATFWRSASSSNSVLADVAQAVAEAVFNESAKEPFTRKSKDP